MLTEDEWSDMEAALGRSGSHDGWLPALALFEGITGMKETNVNAIWHHRASLYGPDCRHCGKPLRTPRARWCACCGGDRD